VLRNLCFQILNRDDGRPRWAQLTARIADLFGARLDEPTYVAERGEVTMTYCEASGVRLDLSSAGRGLQQTLLLLAHLAVNPGSVLLLDEPDAHLEILRQRQIYQVLTDAARDQQSQIIAASHSEIILNEAADRDVVVDFVGKPHRIDDRGSQLLKSLREIGYDQYYQAEQTGWVLYLEGATDLAILRAFAETLSHPARAALERPFVHYVQNQPAGARDHFYGLREAKADLVGFLLLDRIDKPLQQRELRERMWSRREIENYLCQPETLLSYAASSNEESAAGPLFSAAEGARRRGIMQECIDDFVPRAALRNGSDPWWVNTKASDEFLDRVFSRFFDRLALPNLLLKSDYHVLARHVPASLVDNEVREVLDEISGVASRADHDPSPA
jgi:hypothetical protein